MTTKTDKKIEVGNCDNCGQGLYSNSIWMWDGQPLICQDCRMIHWFSCDGTDGGFINTMGKFVEPHPTEKGGSDE